MILKIIQLIVVQKKIRELHVYEKLQKTYSATTVILIFSLKIVRVHFRISEFLISEIP